MEQLLKLIIVGDSGVGKSSLLSRFINNKYDDFSESTIGIDFYVKKLTLNNKLYKFHIWDLAGQERYMSIVNSYYRNGQGILLVFDISSEKSFKNLEKWISCINKYSPINCIITLIGSKNDLKESRKISYEKAKSYADSLNIEYFEISSKNDNDNNINDVFISTLEKLQIELDKENKHKKFSKINLKLEKINKNCCK